jgi:hypothetical protein
MNAGETDEKIAVPANNTAASKASQQGVQPPAIDASQFLKDFDDYLMRVQGLAPRTRSGYCFWASRFVARFCAMDAPDWSSLRAEHLTMFVQQEASRLHRDSRAIPLLSLRNEKRLRRWFTAHLRPQARIVVGTATQIMAIPVKRTNRRLVQSLTREEIDGIPPSHGTPPGTWARRQLVASCWATL